MYQTSSISSQMESSYYQSMSPISSPKPIEDTHTKKIKKKKKTKKKKPSFISDNNPDPTSNPSRAKRTKDPGLRIVHGRVYDSENGKTCHQCRQKTMDFSAACKALYHEKPCSLFFCYKCLLNRYGERADEVQRSDDWECPRCRGICNCSFCMKKRGYRPTGILAHYAKASGYSSVSQLLQENPPEDIQVTPEEDPSVASRNEQGEQVQVSGSEVQLSRPFGERKKHKKLGKRKRSDIIPLPFGTGVDLSTEDVQNALQFLEFCNAFGQKCIEERKRDVLWCLVGCT